MRFRRFGLRLLAAGLGVSMAGIGLMVLAAPAGATVYNIDQVTGGYARCASWQCLTWSANETGADIVFTANVPNLCDSSVCYYFNQDTYGTGGYGQVVRNNAHSMENGFGAGTGCDVETWYSPGYGGNSNVLEANWMGNLNAELVNNEASTKAFVVPNTC
jgi:hypothetical protein